MLHGWDYTPIRWAWELVTYLSRGLDSSADEDDYEDPGEEETEAKMPADISHVFHRMLLVHVHQSIPVRRVDKHREPLISHSYHYNSYLANGQLQ